MGDEEPRAVAEPQVQPIWLNKRPLGLGAFQRGWAWGRAWEPGSLGRTKGEAPSSILGGSQPPRVLRRELWSTISGSQHIDTPSSMEHFGHPSLGPLKTWHSRSPACVMGQNTCNATASLPFFFPRLRLFIVPSQCLPKLSV